MLSRYLCFSRPGPPDCLRIDEEPPPSPAAGEVLVQIEASGFNRADLLQRRGLYPPPAGQPSGRPGLEFAGTVISGGETYSIGAKVMGLVPAAGMSATLAVREDQLMSVPAGVPVADAAAIPEAFLTAWDALFRQTKLKPDETVLVHAAAGGVGSAAVQLAAERGATVIATTRSADKVEQIRDLGANQVELISEGFDAQGLCGSAQVIIDTVGASYFQGNMRALAPRGRWVLLGLLGGSRAEFPLHTLMQKRAQITGTVLRPRSWAEKTELLCAFAADALPKFTSGELRALVHAHYPLRGTDPKPAIAAHRALEAGEVVGKLVLTWA